MLIILIMANPHVRRWCFTLNNYSQGEIQLINDVLSSEHIKYGIYGKESGENSTPHLQGFIIFNECKRLAQVKNLVSQRAHFEAARGSSSQASDYCKKEGDYIEFGTFPGGQGKRKDFEVFRDWIKEQDTHILEADVAEHFPSLYGRYRANCMSMVRLLARPPVLVRGELRQWQRDLEQRLGNEPDDRTIEFIVDENGGKGKSWFTRYYITKNPDITQKLSVGKRDDIAHALDISKRVFFFDIPRSCMQFLQYSILEMIKDQMIFSPKYESITKIMPTKSHVVVFSNEEPDRTAMTHDRYNVTRLWP